MTMLLTSTFRMATRMVRMVEPFPKGKTVAFIAAAGTVEPWGGIHAAVNRWTLRQLGFRVDELDLLRQPSGDIAHRLRDDDVIFVGGGNTFFLMRQLRRTGAARAIVEQVRGGKPYVGESAGAVVTAPDIAYIGLMDPWDKAGMPHGDGEPCPGLGLVDFFTVPHVGGPLLGRAAAAIIARHGNCLPLAPITDRQAIVADGAGDGARMLGPAACRRGRTSEGRHRCG